MWFFLQKHILSSGIGFLVCLSISSLAHSSGFGVFTQGASGLGQANAVVAHADSPSAVYFNPALLNNLPGTQVELGTTLVLPSRKFNSDLTGGTTDAENNYYFPSTLFLTRTFNDKVSAGIGLFNPFGLGSEWNKSWEGRYIATKSELTTYNINPVISVRALPQLTLAAGVDLLLLDASLEQNINLSPMGLPDAGQKFSGDGNGVGFNLGLLLDLGNGFTFGAAYRSEVEIEADGEVSFSLPVPGLEGVFPLTKGKADITLPQQVVLGLSWQISERLVSEIGLRWEDWDSSKELKIDLQQPIAGQNSVTQPKDWHDTYALNLGGRYKLNDEWSILMGYLYGDNPIPDHTFEPAIPDADTHLISIGTEIDFSKFRLALSYAYQFLEERDKNNLVGADVGGTANGSYESNLQLLAASLTYRF